MKDYQNYSLEEKDAYWHGYYKAQYDCTLRNLCSLMRCLDRNEIISEEHLEFFLLKSANGIANLYWDKFSKDPIPQRTIEEFRNLIASFIHIPLEEQKELIDLERAELLKFKKQRENK